MHSWQNGTRCRDSMKVLWCHFHLVSLVFKGSIPIHALFSSRKLFMTCSCCFFFAVIVVLLLLEMAREKRGGSRV